MALRPISEYNFFVVKYKRLYKYYQWTTILQTHKLFRNEGLDKMDTVVLYVKRQPNMPSIVLIVFVLLVVVVIASLMVAADRLLA